MANKSDDIDLQIEIDIEDSQVQKLSQDLQNEKDNHKTHVYALSCFIVLLMNALFMSSTPWYLNAMFIVFEVAVALHFAKKCGVEEIADTLDKAEAHYKNWSEKKSS